MDRIGVGASIPVLAHASARANCGWSAWTDAPDLATRICITDWHFELACDVPWLGVLFLEDGSTRPWTKAGAASAAATQTVRLSFWTYSREGVDGNDVRIDFRLGAGYDMGANITKTLRCPIRLQASQPLVVPHLRTGATVRSGSVIELATINLGEGLHTSLLLVAEQDTESRWRGQWRVRPEIPGDFPELLSCLREWRLSGECPAL